jgi:hypothetical protein
VPVKVRPWTDAEKAVLREEYARGRGWSKRAAARLEGRSAEACKQHGYAMGVQHDAKVFEREPARSDERPPVLPGRGAPALLPDFLADSPVFARR